MTFKELVAQLTVGNVAAGIAAAWGIAHNINPNDIKWEKLPQNERSYVSAG